SKSNSRASSVDDLASNSLSSLVDSLYSSQTDLSKETCVEVVAGANFFQIPLNAQSTTEVMKYHLDLGNSYKTLCLAKKYKVSGLQDAVYNIMSDNYLQVLKDPSIYGQLKASEREIILEKRMKGKRYMVVADLNTQECTQNNPQMYSREDNQCTEKTRELSMSTSKLCVYNEEEDEWHFFCHIPKEAISKGCAMCTMFNYIFIVAGCEGSGKETKPSNRVFCYNPMTDIWREIHPLNQARPHCKLVALDGYLYAIGGECLYTVERYDPRTDRWTFTASLPNETFAVTHMATVWNGEIFVTGGTLRYTLLRYNPKTNTWKDSVMTGSKDRTTELVATKNFLYRFDLNKNLGISVYRYSAAKLWYECAKNRVPYPAPFQCAVMDNVIYCISRQFNMRFLADEVSPTFGATKLKVFPSPKGTLYPLVIMLPDR
uniref:Kelch domain containing 7A n=2 Tax=Latimeria chalumnae TaxID=7897 RepID=H3A935_LATCH